jgi:cytochrome c-type biogenesis protein CcmH
VIRAALAAGALLLVATQARAQNEGFRRFESQNVRETRGRDSVGQLSVPEAVQEHAATTSREDDSLVQAIEHRIHCTCGCNLDVFTCRTTDFTCATSPAMHRAVMARLDSNMTAAQVVAAFESQYGESILMQPPKRGFNLAAYVTPFIALGLGALILGAWMRRWVRARPKDTGAAAEAAAATDAAAQASAPDELERLKRELEKFEA